MDYADNAGVAFRWTDINNHYLVQLCDDSGTAPTTNMIFFKRVAGTYTQLGTANVTWARNTVGNWKISMVGSALQVHFDNVLVYSVTDTTYAAAGSVALRTNGTKQQYLDFTGSDPQPFIRLTQCATEVVILPASPIRITQLAFEVVVLSASPIRLTQFAVEVPVSSAIQHINVPITGTASLTFTSTATQLTRSAILGGATASLTFTSSISSMKIHRGLAGTASLTLTNIANVAIAFGMPSGTASLTFTSTPPVILGTRGLTGTSTIVFGQTGAVTKSTVMTGSGTASLKFTGYSTLTVNSPPVAPPSSLVNIKKVMITMPVPVLDSRGRPS